MGLLKKLAELVIEFPEEEGSAAGGGKPNLGKAAGSKASGDVVDAIEQIRRDLELSMEPDFTSEQDKPGAKSSTDKEQPAMKSTSQPSSKPDPKTTSAIKSGPPKSSTGEVVLLPEVLNVEGVYERAELTGKDFDIYKVEALMGDKEVADLEPAMRARMVRMTLKNLDKDLNDILSDAGRRDAALEAYSRLLAQQGADLAADVESINAAVQQEIDAFVQARTAVINANEQRLADYQAMVKAFKDAKRAEEERLFNIAAPFVEEGANPVDVS